MAIQVLVDVVMELRSLEGVDEVEEIDESRHYDYSLLYMKSVEKRCSFPELPVVGQKFKFGTMCGSAIVESVYWNVDTEQWEVLARSVDWGFPPHEEEEIHTMISEMLKYGWSYRK